METTRNTNESRPVKKGTVLMVDDDRRILDGLRRGLHALRDEWEFDFAESGPEALELMSRKHYDVLVSDMRMPGMNGAELLKEVSRRHPGTIRYILSGYSDRELVLQVLGYAHRYIAKPCDPETLAQHIRTSMGLRHVLLSEKLRTLVSRIGRLPGRPRLYNELVAELQSETASIGKVAELVSQDVALSAKVLQIVNSAFFGLPRHVESIREAVNLIGFETIQGMVLTAGVFHEFSGPHLPELPIDPFYEHCLEVGAGAKTIASMLQLERNAVDDAMIAGMMHDIGKLVLLTHATDELKKAFALVRSEEIPLHEAEYRIMGVSHAELGAYLLSLWGLPETVLEPVTFHHQPAHAAEGKPGVVAAVYLADVFANEARPVGNLNRTSVLDDKYISDLGLADEIPRFRDAVLSKAASAQGV